MSYLKYLLIVVILSILFIKPNIEQVNKIEVDLKNDETLINFIFDENLNALYIQDNSINSLVILDYKDDEKAIEKKLIENGINSIDKLYTITPVILNLFDTKSEYYKTLNNLIRLNYNNNNFCIYIEEYQNAPDLKSCKFLYIFKFKYGIFKNIIGNPEVIFQNENNPLPIKTQEQIYDDWTELYTINNLEYTILKISEEGFDTIIIQK